MSTLPPFVTYSLAPRDVERSIGDQFEEQVRLRGDALAVQDGERTYTYVQLNAAANAVGHTLQARSPRMQEVVAVLVADGAGMILALLALWKAGKIAIPIDPALPKVRLQQVLDESAAELLLVANAAETADFADIGLPIVDLESAAVSGSAENLSAPVPADAHAIVLFTSGSTGTPRGVVIDHQGLVYRSMLIANLYECRAGDRQLLMSSCRHIAGTIVVLLVLLTGGSLFVYSLKQHTTATIAQALKTHAITVFATIVTIARQVIGGARSGDGFPDLRVIAMGGEPVLYRDFALFAPHVPPTCRFVNVLGSTEFLLYAAHVVDRSRSASDGQVPIGDTTLPVDLRLVDDDGRAVGANEVGEMLVRSRYLARGYWRRPGVTAAAFVADADDPAITSFRTGDLGQRRDDGSIFYMGRKDAQVKVRGYRIEPIEVEMALLDHPDVAECAVVASERAPGDRQLVAYLRPREGAALDVRSVIAHARARLPDYMVPSAFPMVATLGQTHSGKIDRRSLPPFDWSSYERSTVGGEPRTETERTLVSIWREVLGHDGIGIHDDFLELGGDSLRAIRLFSRVEDVLGRKLQLGILFNAATIAKQAELIDAPQIATPTVVAIQPTGTRPALFCVPGFDGEVMVFTQLARHLGPDQPFYALYPRFIEGTADAAVSVETVAAHYADAICGSHLQDRYFIGGFSSGGVIALEVARLLAARGHHVALVALFDSFVTTDAHPTLRGPSPARTISRFTEHFLSPADNRLQLVRALQAVRRHVSSPYAGRLDLFRARGPESTDDHGWGRLARDFHVHDVAGDHFTMLQPPHVQDLAARLRAVMDGIPAVTSLGKS